MELERGGCVGVTIGECGGCGVWRVHSATASRAKRCQPFSLRAQYHLQTWHLGTAKMAQSDDEDDYMNMTFEDPKPQVETALQRAARKRKEGEARARQQTRKEREAEAERAREEALKTSLPETSKGFKMMAKFGFKQGDTLGKAEDARKEPIAVSIKEGRSGIGMESEKKRKNQALWDEAQRAAKRAREQEGDFLEERRKQQKEKHMERDLDNAQRTAERLADTDGEGETDSGEPVDLKDINVLWRGRARRRMEREQERRQAKEIDNTVASRLPKFAAEDDEHDDDTKVALGQDVTPFYKTIENKLEDDDPELLEFEALPVAERLQKLLVFLRDTYRYCLYCGFQYPDAGLAGCPGITEEEHD